MPFEIFSMVSELLNPKTFLIKLLSEGRDLACRLLLCLGTSLGENLGYLGFCFCSTFLITLLITGCMGITAGTLLISIFHVTLS